MSGKSGPSEPARLYAAHYSERNSARALQRYVSIIDSHPTATEAGYSRTQVLDIVNAVVPEQELLDAHLKLAFEASATPTEPLGRRT